MYLQLTLRVLFESHMFRDYKYPSRNRRQLLQIITKMIAYGINALMTPWESSAHSVKENCSCPPCMASKYGPMMQYSVKAKAYGLGGEPS